MRLNTGIITDKLEETKSFYVDKLGFSILWEADWFILLATPNGADTISFLVPNHPTQELSNFRKPFNGNGIYLTIEVENVDSYYEEIKKSGTNIALDIRSEVWGDRHFALIDPNNIGIDFVTHTKTEK
jgi:catechol 2,3-dioxygenase-like lactoylglutathione lyase family enzyme